MDPEIATMLNDIKEFFTFPFFAFLGAITLYILNRANDKQPFSLFRAINVDVISSSATPANILWDMFISSSLGAVVVIALVSPTTVPQAIISGLGMTGILAAHTKQTS